MRLWFDLFRFAYIPNIVGALCLLPVTVHLSIDS